MELTINSFGYNGKNFPFTIRRSMEDHTFLWAIYFTLKWGNIMAERRMFAKSIVLSDAFLDMPMSARCLYFTLSMLADDDGFVGNPKSIMRQCGASQDDMVILLQKRYVLGFDSGIIVIKHWRINNYLRDDRHKNTTYIEEMCTLTTDSKGAYTEIEKVGIPNANQLPTNGIPSIGKDSIDKYSIGKVNNISSEQSEIVTEQEEVKYFIKLPLNDNTEYGVPENDINEWKSLYPSVDVEQELRNMRGWLLANKTKKKTRSGINRFINTWLSKSQDRCKKKNNDFDVDAYLAKRGSV